MSVSGPGIQIELYYRKISTFWVSISSVFMYTFICGLSIQYCKLMQANCKSSPELIENDLSCLIKVELQLLELNSVKD